MSAFVLNREYALQLPNSYVDVDRDEMEYVDGGWSVTKRFYNSTGINGLRLVALGYTAATLVAAFGAVITGATGIGLVAFGLVGAYSGTIAWKFWDAYNDASYFYNRYLSYYITISGIGPLITGVRVDEP